MSEYKEEFKRKLAAFEIVKAEVDAFIAAGGDLRTPEAAPLGLCFMNAANEMWVASGGKPFIVPIDPTEKK
jgi:hypothetical protein